MKQRANRIHITSSGPRTGTTLLAEVMKTCFEINCYCDHEAPLALSNSSFGECDTILTKHPSSTRNLDKILKWDPNLFVICVIRDPRDMVCSYHGRISDKYYCDLQFWLDFVKNHNRLQGRKRVLFIKYEEFTKNPDLTQEQIMKEMPFLSKKHDFSDFHLYATPVGDSIKALKTLRPIESKGIGNWKTHLPRIKQQIHEFGSIDNSLIFFGYENDRAWLRILNDVELKGFQSYKSNMHRNKGNIKTLMLIYLNICLEKRGINPDKLLAPFKRIF